MKLGIIPLHRLHQPLNDDLRFQFLPNLTLQCLLRTLTGFHLPPGKLPTIFIIAIPPLRCKDTALLIMNNRCYDFNLLHYPTIERLPMKESKFYHIVRSLLTANIGIIIENTKISLLFAQE